MTILHAFIIGGNLLLAMILYVITATSRRGELLRVVLVGAFALAALVELSIGGSSEHVLFSVLAFDVVLVALIFLFARSERRGTEA